MLATATVSKGYGCDPREFPALGVIAEEGKQRIEAVAVPDRQKLTNTISLLLTQLDKFTKSIDSADAPSVDSLREEHKNLQLISAQYKALKDRLIDKKPVVQEAPNLPTVKAAPYIVLRTEQLIEEVNNFFGEIGGSRKNYTSTQQLDKNENSPIDRNKEKASVFVAKWEVLVATFNALIIPLNRKISRLNKQTKIFKGLTITEVEKRKFSILTPTKMEEYTRIIDEKLKLNEDRVKRLDALEIKRAKLIDNFAAARFELGFYNAICKNGKPMYKSTYKTIGRDELSGKIAEINPKPSKKGK